MKKKLFALLICLVLLFCGCTPAPVETPDPSQDSTPPEDVTPPEDTTPDQPEEPVNPLDVYVDPVGGSDENVGSKASPVKTLPRAQELARENIKQEKDVTVWLQPGRYELHEPLVFTDADDGSDTYTVTWRAAKKETAIISGGIFLNDWKMHDAEKGIYVASLPEGATAQTRDLFVNGKRATVSRTDPNDRFIDSKFTKETITTKVPSLANLERPQDVNIVLRNMWSESRTMVESAVTEGDTTTLYMVQPGWTNYNVTAPAGGDRISSAHFSFFENAYEFLDQKGEWYINPDERTVYYIPRDGEDMTQPDIAVLGQLEQLICLDGTKEAPVKNLVFDGLTFSDTTWRQRLKNEGLLTVQANTYKSLNEKNDGYISTGDMWGHAWNMPLASIYGIYLHEIEFSNNTFVNLGSAALHLDEGTKDSVISKNTFYDCAGTGITLGSTRFEHQGCIKKDGSNLEQDWYRITERNLIQYNNIDTVASVYSGGCGIWVGFTRESVIDHNTLANLPYTGISLGWGWGASKTEMSNMWYRDENGLSLFGRNQVSHNYIDNIMNVLYDGGGIYTQGRNDESAIFNNYITGLKQDFAAIYLDDGSQGFDVYNNVIVDCVRNYLYKGDYNKIHDNYAKINFKPDMDSISPLDPKEPHYVFENNYLSDKAAEDEIFGNSGH